MVAARRLIPSGNTLAAVPADAVLGELLPAERVACRASRYAVAVVDEAGPLVAPAAPSAAVDIGAVWTGSGDMAGVAAVPAFQCHRNLNLSRARVTVSAVFDQGSSQDRDRCLHRSVIGGGFSRPKAVKSRATAGPG